MLIHPRCTNTVQSKLRIARVQAAYAWLLEGQKAGEIT
jgi:hypothetical protein